MDWTIKGLLPKGLYLLADREKGGKSYLSMQMALAVVQNRPLFPNRDDFRPERAGRAHYFDLEMDDETWKKRIRELCDTNDRLMFLKRFTEIGKITESGIAELDDLLQREPVDFLVIDTLTAAVRAAGAKNQDVFRTEYEELAVLRDLAHRREMTVLVNHHTNRQIADNVFDTISGTRGRGAATDGNLVIARKGGVVTLHAVSRRTAPVELAIALWRGNVPGWQCLGEAEDVKRSAQRDEVLTLLSKAGAMQPKDIAAALGKQQGAVRKLVFAMLRDGELERHGDGTYSAILTPEEAGSKC